jgi:uncharacterized membrane protein
MGVALFLHVLAVVIWVGGMFFAYMCLRPVAASQLEPPARLTLWSGVFARFFPWVFASIAIILATGLWMVYAVFGGFRATGLYINLMFWLGLIMMLIFFHVYFAPYRRLRRAVEQADWPSGGKKLAQIRVLVGINTLLGLLVITIASGGRYLLQ